MYGVYSAALGLFLIVSLPALLARWVRRGYGGTLRPRWSRFAEGLPAEPRCWIHAVSVGEAAAAVPLVHSIRRRWPELSIVVSTVTPTGARVVSRELGGVATHRYFPLDFPGPVRRALTAVQPRFFIGLETELWPNFLRALGRRGIPSMIANGRISDRSFRRYRLVRPFFARVLSDVTVFAMQSAEDARRIVALGAPAARVIVTGNMKADARQEPAGNPEWATRLGLERRSLWIAGSTHRGEEALIVDAYLDLKTRFPNLTLLLAPRHPERAVEVERLCRSRGVSVVRRSALPSGGIGEAVIILDTVGELAALYTLGEVVFVGGSLVPSGGHNMLEPAQRSKPILFGPHTENFRESAALLLSAGGAVVVKDALDLVREIEKLLEEPALGRQMGEAARAAVASRQGALDKTLALIEGHLIGART
jgi:3-deoxy-D-manno-octulosonic-acid transferase